MLSFRLKKQTSKNVADPTFKLASELESDLLNTADWGRKCHVGFNAGKINLLCLTGLITLVAVMSKWMCLFLRKKIF